MKKKIFNTLTLVVLFSFSFLFANNTNSEVKNNSYQITKNTNFELVKTNDITLEIDTIKSKEDFLYICSCYATITNSETGYTETINMTGFGLTAADACANCYTNVSFAAKVRIRKLQND